MTAEAAVGDDVAGNHSSHVSCSGFVDAAAWNGIDSQADTESS
jgi:hypothetical protein